MDKKRILVLICSTGWGGLEINTKKIITKLIDQNCSIYFAGIEGSKFDSELSIFGFNKLTFAKRRKYFDFKNASLLADFVNKNGIETIFSTYRPDLDLIYWAKRKFNSHVKVVHQQHMQIGISKKGFFQKLRYGAIDSWIAPLESLKQEVIEKTSVPESKIIVAPIGVESLNFVNSRIDKNLAQAHFNCKTSDFLIGVIGRVDSKKGQLFLVQAIDELRSSGEKVSLLVVGSPTINDSTSILYFEEIKNYIAQNELAAYVFFADFTNEISQFYAAIDCFVMSSTSETYGMVTLEAMLSKVPVIGTSAGGTSELLDFGRRGVLYEFGNMKSFVDAYYSMKENVSTTKFNLDSIQKEIVEQFDVQLEIEAILQVL